MKRVSSLAAVLALVAAPVSAQTFNWSWVDQGTNTVVGGTLTGLSEGANSTFGVTVNQSIYGDLIDTNSADWSGSGEVDVAGGHITFVNASWLNITNNASLFLGTDAAVTTFYPELANGSFSENQVACCGGNFITFTAAVAQGSVPEPASWALMLAGFGAVGGAMRYRRRAVRFA